MNEEKIRRLISLMEDNNGKAFEEFFNMLYPRFYRYAFLYLKSDVLTEEVVSDVFLKLWNVRGKLNDIQQLEFYLFRSVKNQVLTYLKKKSTTHLELDFAIPQLVEYNQPDNILIGNELAEQMQLAIEKLPPKCQTIFRMVREDGLSYRQVATLLDISTKTVENHMSKAIRRLRKFIEQYDSQVSVKKTSIFTLFFC